jgi:hypothetical protein
MLPTKILKMDEYVRLNVSNHLLDYTVSQNTALVFIRVFDSE